MPVDFLREWPYFFADLFPLSHSSKGRQVHRGACQKVVVFGTFIMSRTLHFIATTAALIATLITADAWRAARRNSAQLTATLDSQKILLEQAAAREQQRNAQLAIALSSIAAEKKRIQTPRQAVEAMPSVLPTLPVPIKVSLPDLSEPPKPGDATPASISIPQSDLIPLYDSLQDCRACALERDTAKKDLTDERARISALTRERDAAAAAAHGGNFWSRLKHATKWFVIGVAAGAVARTASHR
jgi:hypothetical protein